MYPGKNPGGERSGGMLDQKNKLSQGSSAMETAKSTVSIADQLSQAKNHLRELKYKPNLTAKELEEAEDLVRSLDARRQAEAN
jgi:hypothetical protein